MRISIIVAVAENGVIGRGGTLPWRLSDDLKRFKRLTMGHTMVMGRKTWESIGRPLVGRRMVVVSRQADYRTEFDAVAVAKGIDAAIALAAAAGDAEVFVIGGAELYRETLGRADRLYVTRVLADVPGDTLLPAVNWNEWTKVESETRPADAANEFAVEFQVFERS